MLCLYGAVCPRPGGGYRMWYNTLARDKGRHNDDEARIHYRICYAESDDGVEWVKPNIGVYEWRGSKQNNIVIGEEMVNDRGEWLTDGKGAQSFSLLLEPGPAADDGLLHGFSLLKPPDIEESEPPLGKGGICHIFSEDGLKWYRSPKRFLLITGHSDTPNNVHWNEEEQKYFCVMRPNVCANLKRRIAISVSTDLEQWTQQEVCLFPDEADPPTVENLYGMGVFPYEGMWLGTLELYDDHDGTIAVQLAHSRDGVHWQRPPMRDALIPWGPDGAFDHSMIHTSVRPFVKDGKIHLYYDGTAEHHGAGKQQSGGIGLATWRLDGFVSRSAHKEGFILTRPFVCEGEYLFVNAHVKPAGQLLTEVLKVDTASDDQMRSTKTAEGYARDDCVPFVADSVDAEIVWANGSNLAPFKGKVIRLKFHLIHTDLFAFRISD